MADQRNFLDMISDLMKTGPAQGALEYTAPSPAVSMARRQFSNQNYPGSDPLFDKIQAQTRDMRATTDLTRGLQRDQIGEYFTGTPKSYAKAAAVKNNVSVLPAEIRAMAEGFNPASPFPTPAAPPPPPTVAETVANNQLKAYETGGLNGNRQAQSGRGADMAKTLMGGDMGEFMQKLLRATLQPEFQQPGFGGLGQVMLGATNALRAVETQDAETAKLEAAANTEMLKARTVMAKAKLEAGGWDAKSFQVDLVRDADKSMRGLGTINELQKLIQSGWTTGGLAGAANAARGLAALAGVNLNVSNQQEYKASTDILVTQLLSIYGKEVNKSEWENLFELIAKPGAFKGNKQLADRLNKLTTKLSADLKTTTRTMDEMGVPYKSILRNSETFATKNGS